MQLKKVIFTDSNDPAGRFNFFLTNLKDFEVRFDCCYFHTNFSVFKFHYITVFNKLTMLSEAHVKTDSQQTAVGVLLLIKIKLNLR